MGRALVRHWLVFIVLAVAIALRVVLTVAYRPAIIFPDSVGYLYGAQRAITGEQRQGGYSLLIEPFLHLGPSLTVLTIVQHVLGVAVVVVMYAALLRNGVRPWLAALGVSPLALDAVPAYIEQFVMSDTFANSLLLLGLAALLRAGKTPSWWALGSAGVLFGCSASIRIANLVAVLVAASFLLFVHRTRVRGLAAAGALTLAAAVPLAGYAALYHQDHGRWALTGDSSLMGYSRVSRIIDCGRLDLPDYERPLCPAQALGHRKAPDFYAWDVRSPAYHLKQSSLPPDRTVEQVRTDFVQRVMWQERTAYAWSVFKNIGDLFPANRGDAFWARRDRWLPTKAFPTFGFNPQPSVARFDNGRRVELHKDAAGVAYYYGRIVVTPGPLLGLLLIVALATGCGAGNREGRRLRILLIALTGMGTLIISVASLYSSIRYQVLAAALIPVAAALGISSVLESRSPETSDATVGTERDATASTTAY
ncbi:MAG: hypothetical protein ACR2F6_05130 [Mycobacteriales bacterium]